MRAILLLLLLILAACTTTTTTTTTTSPLVGQAAACSTDIYVCPDGTLVGRIYPACQFAPCPNRVIVCDYTVPNKDYFFRNKWECNGRIFACPGSIAFNDVCGCGCLR
jgi:hypothetical protein